MVGAVEATTTVKGYAEQYLLSIANLVLPTWSVWCSRALCLVVTAAVVVIVIVGDCVFVLFMIKI